MLAREMKMVARACLLVISSIFLYSGKFILASSSYDYSATTQCLKKPNNPLHGGGLIVNPELTNGVKGWNLFGHGEMREGRSSDGNRFLVAFNRTQPLDSVSQTVHLKKGRLYSFSGWVQISEGSEIVALVFRTAHGKLIHGGMAIAKHGCWSLLKGGLVAQFSGPVEILFQCKNTKVEIWVDNVSLQPFTAAEWRSHQEKSIDKVRKTNVRFHVTCDNKTQLKGADVSIKQTRSSFPFGCGMNHHILTSKPYQSWFASRFKFTTFTNEMKWYSTEIIKHKENYTVADAMLRFAKRNGIAVRGHNIFWDNPKQQPAWVKGLSRRELQKAATKRINSVVRRYARRLIAWDVMNENLHFRFFEDKLGRNASALYYWKAHQLDPHTRMFMNEYNTIEDSKDEHATAVNYVKKLEQILSYPGNKGMLAGIGVQGHFGPGQPNLVYMRSALDILGSTGLPVWLTEVDISKGPRQRLFLEEILREGYSHPAVKGIIMFAGPEAAGFNVTTLADKDFKNTPTGDVVDKLMKNWKTDTVEFTTKSQTESPEISLFHGKYHLTVKNPNTNVSTTMSFKVKEEEPHQVVDVHVPC